MDSISHKELTKKAKLVFDALKAQKIIEQPLYYPPHPSLGEPIRLDGWVSLKCSPLQDFELIRAIERALCIEGVLME